MRQTRLKDEDWARVSWRARAPQPVPRIFDFELLLRHAQAGGWRTRTGWERETAVSGVPACLSQEEAWFWLQCISVPDDKQPCFEERLRSAHVTEVPGELTLRPLIARLALSHEFFGFDTPQTLAPFMTAAEIAALILRKTGNAPGGTSRHDGSPWAVLGFASHIAPYLREPERAALRVRLERAWDAEPSPHTPRARLLLALLASLGGGERLATYLECLPDGAWAHPPANPLWHHWRSGYLDMLAGLPSETDFVSAARRLGCLPRGPSDVRLWLAATQWRQLDVVRDAIIAVQHDHEAATLVRLLGQVESPETARAMLEAQLSSRASQAAAGWLEAHPQHTATGLIPVAMGQGRLAHGARAQLQRLHLQGHTDVLAAAARQLATADGAWLQREILHTATPARPDAAKPAAATPAPELPAALRLAFAGLRSAPCADWLRTEVLPPIWVQGRRLTASQILWVLTALRDTPLGAGAGPAAELLATLKAHAHPASLDAFAGQLLEMWWEQRERGGGAGEEWCLAAVGHLGGDGCVWQLAPLLHSWAGQRLSQLAMFGLACLGAISSPTALMAIEGVARKHRAGSVKRYASGILRRIAQARGLNREELIDLSVPDCGLAAAGGRRLNYGPRQLQVVLGPQLTPLLRERSGKLRTRPPACAKDDDTSLAKAAVLEWHVLKRTLQEARDMQLVRLEDAMVNGRRWPPAQLARMMSNPVMASLLRGLVFAVYEGAGRALQTFRFTEDQSLAGPDDHELPLPQDGVIGVAHPAHLDEGLLSGWAQMLGDYEIIQPFQQLGRPVQRPDSADLACTEITRHRGVQVPDHLMRGLLAQGRFVHDTPPEVLSYLLHSRHFAGANVTAVIRHAPVHSALWHREVQRFDAIYFIAGSGSPRSAYEDDRERLAIGAVDPGVLSEVLSLVRAAVEPPVSS